MRLKYRAQEWLADRIKGIQYPQHQPHRHKRYSYQASKKHGPGDYIIASIAIFFFLALGIGAICIGGFIIYALVSPA